MMASPLKGSPPPPFIVIKRGGVQCTGDRGSRRLSPESRGCSGRTLWEVHYGAWRRAWQSSWVSSLVLRKSRQHPVSPSSQRGHRCRVYSPPDVAWWRSVGPAGQGLAYIRAPAVAGHAAVPDPPGWSAGVCTKEVRESHGDLGPLEGGGPGLRLLVLSVPP